MIILYIIGSLVGLWLLLGLLAFIKSWPVDVMYYKNIDIDIDKQFWLNFRYTVLHGGEAFYFAYFT